MQTQLRVGVARGGRLVDDRWLPPGPSLTIGGDRRADWRIPSARDLPPLLARPGRHGSTLALPPGVEGEWCDGSGAVVRLDGRAGRDVTLSSGARAWLRVGDAVLYLQQAPRPPPPPRSTLPRGVTVGRRPLDRRLAGALALASVALAALVVSALRRPGVAEPFDVVPAPSAAPVFVLPPKPLEPKPVKVELEPVATPRPRPSEAPAPRAPGEGGDRLDAIRRGVRARPIFEAIGAVGGGVFEPADLRRELAILDGIPRPFLDPTAPRPRVPVAVVPGPILDVVIDPGVPFGPRPDVPIAERPRDPVAPPPPDDGITAEPLQPPEPDDPDEARMHAFVKSRLRSLKACYDTRAKLLGRGPAGKLLLSFEVGSDGITTSIEVVDGGLRDPEIAACVTRVVRSWRVKPPPAVAVPVQLPLVFSPAAR